MCFKSPWAFHQVPSSTQRLHQCFHKCLTHQSNVWSGSAAPWKHNLDTEHCKKTVLPRLKATFQAGRRKAPSKVHAGLLPLRLSQLYHLSTGLRGGGYIVLNKKIVVTFQKGSLLKSRIGLHFSSSKLLQMWVTCINLDMRVTLTLGMLRFVRNTGSHDLECGWCHGQWIGPSERRI